MQRSTATQAPGRGQAYPRPIWRVTVGDTDVSGIMRPRLMSLTLTECRGEEADQLDIALDDSDGGLQLPTLGVTLRVAIGWASTGLIDKGTFIVDEVEYSGAPDVITLRARSADLTAELRTRTERSFHGKTIEQIVSTIADAHDLTPTVGSFGKVTIAHIDQTNESDLAFLNRIGKRYDAVVTIKDGRLLFLPIERGVTASGKAMPTLTLARRDGDRVRFHVADRDSYTGVRAFWQDNNKARRRSVLVGVIGNAKRLRTTFGSEADALENARAEWQRIQRGAATFQMDLAYGRPDLSPQMRVSVPSLKPPIGGYDWLLVRLKHKLDDGGLTTSIEAETAEAADARKKDDAHSGGDLPAVDDGAG